MAKAQPVLGVEPEAPPIANAALILPVRIAEVLAWERFVEDPTHVEELHEMRIAAKRLRYTLEIFAPWLGKDGAAAIATVKVLQDHLGFIHDCDVLVPELERHLAGMLEPVRARKKAVPVGVHLVDADGAAGLIRICRQKRAERDDRYRQFVSAWRQLLAERFFDNLKATVRRRAAEEMSAQDYRFGGNDE
jgi:hypothetical protein